jgi:iron complex transport system substrate-binding protein
MKLKNITRIYHNWRPFYMVNQAKYSVFFLFWTFLLITTGCASQPTVAPTQSAPIKLTDGLGREITLATPAQRVVSLAGSNTEILFAVKAGSLVVGRDEFSDYPVEAINLPSIGGSFTKYNYEAIVALKPDLVLAAEINTIDQVKALEDLGITVFMVSNPTTLDEMYARLLTVAQLTGRTSEANTLVEKLKARVDSVQKVIAGVTFRPRVFYEMDSTTPNAPFTAGPGTFVDLLIQQAGGENVGSSLGSSWPQISIEQLIILNPDMILLGDAAYGVTTDSVKQRAGWNALTAVKNERIYPINDILVTRPGPRLVDGLEALAKLLHPDLFK